MQIISTAAFVVFVIALTIYTWYYFKYKRPYDKEMEDREDEINDYEIRKFK
jgi:hypothetical protein